MKKVKTLISSLYNKVTFNLSIIKFAVKMGQQREEVALENSFMNGAISAPKLAEFGKLSRGVYDAEKEYKDFAIVYNKESSSVSDMMKQREELYLKWKDAEEELLKFKQENGVFIYGSKTLNKVDTI